MFSSSQRVISSTREKTLPPLTYKAFLSGDAEPLALPSPLACNGILWREPHRHGRGALLKR